MAARKRAVQKEPTGASEPTRTISEPKNKTKPGPKPKPEEQPIAPAKWTPVLAIFVPLLLLYCYGIFYGYKIESELKNSILINAGLSFVGFWVTRSMIPVASKFVSRRNLFGYDINKKGTPLGSVKVPESLGIVVGIVFLVVAILFQYSNFKADSIWLVEYNAALASICFMILLGFVDDVLDVPWRVKLVLPSVAALPLLMAYAGHTTIVIPKPLVQYFGKSIDLGWVYKLYMGLLAVFCTNSVNIHAGINGLEVGQTIVIACAILVHNIMQIGGSKDPEYQQAHAFSIYLVQPLIATSLALFSFNWYPSSAFVGDTYTYFAGMTMAVVGILGHFSETLLIFFAPQVLNFLTSLPQLAGIVYCPRHRLPRFDPQSGLLTGTKDGTLVNIFLRLFGRRSESSLCIGLLSFQAICCCFCFFLRWILTGWYK
ncbi:hypothetical protein ACH5RR_007211 [Cinchona calisaya]|uniref:UDP-N-acetylglucosamine--dolichyl-phosphate N-acetylglucosaminephosphotransferase n=1 Tax=Cinchona calisaya TaxID=153742 RepID=A0ABD3ARA0_9GENT